MPLVRLWQTPVTDAERRCNLHLDEARKNMGDHHLDEDCIIKGQSITGKVTKNSLILGGSALTCNK